MKNIILEKSQGERGTSQKWRTKELTNQRGQIHVKQVCDPGVQNNTETATIGTWNASNERKKISNLKTCSTKAKYLKATLNCERI